MLGIVIMTKSVIGILISKTAKIDNKKDDRGPKGRHAIAGRVLHKPGTSPVS